MELGLSYVTARKWLVV